MHVPLWLRILLLLAIWLIVALSPIILMHVPWWLKCPSNLSCCTVVLILLFLKAIFDECARLFCSGITAISSVLDLTDFVESSADLCKKHQADICALINNSGDSLPFLSQSGECEPHLSRVLSQSGDMHDLISLQHSIFDEQLNLLIECVRKVLWCKIITFLHDTFPLL